MKRMLSIAAIFCMGSSLPTLKYRALDGDGDPISGALLYFYEAGTTTPLATYSDEALSSANANPVVADSNGWFGEIYLKTDEAYKVVLKNSDASTTYWTIDDINATQLVSDAFQVRVKQVASNPLDYGAVGDGLADESSYVQSAIDNATGTVDLLGKTYRCDTALSIDTDNDDITIKNGILDFSNSSEDSYVVVQGSVGANNNLTSSATVGDVTLAVTTGTGISSGDWLGLWSTGFWASSFYIGEIVQVDSIAGTTVTLHKPIEASYATGDTARVAELTTVKRVHFEDVHFIASTSASGNGDVILAQYVESISVKGCTFSNFKRYAINAFASIGLSVTGCEFNKSGASGMALYTRGFNNDLKFSDNRISRTSDGVEISDDTSAVGQSRWVDIRGNTFEVTTSPIVSGRSTQYVLISDNSATCSGDGIFVRGIDSKVIGNTIQNASDGIYVRPSPSFDAGAGKSVTVSNNHIKNSSAVGVETTLGTSIELIISGNTIEDGTVGIHTEISNTKIIGNTIHGQSSYGIQVAESLFGIENVVISDNHIYDSPNGVDIIDAHADEMLISNNILESDSSSSMIAIDVYSGENISISNNTITGNNSNVDGVNLQSGVVTSSVNDNIFNKVSSAITINSCSRITISGNKIYTTGASIGLDINGNTNDDIKFSSNAIFVGTGGYGIKQNNNGNISRASITGNSFTVSGASGYGIAQTGSSSLTNSSITGNIFRLGTTAYGIFQDAAGSPDMSNVSITGNQFTPSTYTAGHILLDTATYISITGNVFNSSIVTQSNIALNGSGAASINYVIIDGNVFRLGVYPVAEATDANATNIVYGSNMESAITNSGCQGTCTITSVVRSAANTACNTTCNPGGSVSPMTCFSGYDDGAGAVVNCAAAAADHCVCYP